MSDAMGRSAGIFAVACVCGVAFALIPPTGVLALMAYSKEGFVSWKTGLLLIPGIFLGGIAGGKAAKWIKPRLMRQVFAGILFALGALQAFSAWWH